MEAIKTFIIALDYITIKALKFIVNYILVISMPLLIGFYSVLFFLQTQGIEGFILAFHFFIISLSFWLILYHELNRKILNKYNDSTNSQRDRI